MKLERHMTALLLVFALLPSPLYSMLLIPWIFYIIARRGWQVASPALTPIWPAFALMGQGLIFGEFSDPGAMVRDGWYILKMLLVFQAGTLIGYYTPLGSSWIRPLAWAAALISLHQAVIALIGIGDAYSRHLAFVSVFLVPFILMYYPGMTLLRWLLVSPTLLTIALAQSRTAIIVILVAWLGARGILHSKLRLTLSAIALVVVGSFVFQFLPDFETGDTSFLARIKNSAQEVSLEEGLDKRSMYGNWRGFEAYRAITTWGAGSTLEQVFGGGFGKYIDLGTVATLNDQDYAEIPFAHNGYFTILVKFGLFGLLLFGYQLALPFILATSQTNPDARLAARIATSTSIMLIFTTLVIAGPLNKSSLDGICLLFGFSLGALHRAQSLQWMQPDFQVKVKDIPAGPQERHSVPS